MYQKWILGTVFGLVVFSGESFAEDCNLTYGLQGDSYVVTGASNKSDCTTVNIPATYEGKPVTGVGDYAFRYANLENVTIPDSVTSIGLAAFQYTPLTSVTIPDSVTYIGERAFGQSAITSANIQGKNVEVNVLAFDGCNGVTYADTITWSCGTSCTAKLDHDGNLTVTGTGSMNNIALGFKSDFKNVIIEEGITEIGDYAFRYTNLENVTIPDSVTSIGLAAFQYTPLTSVTIPDSVTSIGEAAFYSTQLTSLTIPDSVTSIGVRAFAETPLTEIFCSKASVESGKCASLASAGNANVSNINFGYYKDDAMSDERVFYLKDENGVWQEAKRESIYEKYVADTGAVYLYDSKGNLKKMRGKKIYTVEEAEEATKNGNSFHVGLTYK